MNKKILLFILVSVLVCDYFLLIKLNSSNGVVRYGTSELLRGANIELEATTVLVLGKDSVFGRVESKTQTCKYHKTVLEQKTSDGVIHLFPITRYAQDTVFFNNSGMYEVVKGDTVLVHVDHQLVSKRVTKNAAIFRDFTRHMSSI